jgi:hypothetical protein
MLLIFMFNILYNYDVTGEVCLTMLSYVRSTVTYMYIYV